MSRSSKRWRRARQLLTLAFFILVPVLVISLLRNLDWGEVHDALAAYRWQTLALAVLISASSFTLFSCFDLLGRQRVAGVAPATRCRPGRSCPWRSSAMPSTSTSAPGSEP